MASLATSVSLGALLPITGESKDRHDHHVGLREANIEKKNCNRCKRTENKDRSNIVIIVILAARCSREEQSELGRS